MSHRYFFFVAQGLISFDTIRKNRLVSQGFLLFLLFVLLLSFVSLLFVSLDLSAGSVKRSLAPPLMAFHMTSGLSMFHVKIPTQGCTL